MGQLTKEQLEEKLAQAYQVIGFVLAKGVSIYDWNKGGWASPEETEYVRALDYFSNQNVFDPMFLPWPYPKV